MISPKYYFIYKPFGMLSQFTQEGSHKTLADLNYHFPKNVYPVGRLDADSEGLLFLTNDRQLNNILLNPKYAHNRTYWAQVEGAFTEEAKSKLEKGVSITVDGKEYKTLPAKVAIISDPILPERNPPIRFRKHIPVSWIELTLHEGKNRQVRKMTAAVGFPTLRLVRVRIENFFLGTMRPGEVQEVKNKEVLSLLNI